MHDGTSKTQVTGSISSTSIGSKVVSSIMMEIKLRGWRIKIQNTKDYGLSGKVDYLSNTFIMQLILFHSTNQHKQGRYFWEYFWSIFYSHTYPQFKEIVHILSNYRGKYSEISFQTQDTLCLMHKLHFGGRFKKVSWFLFKKNVPSCLILT